MDLEKFTERSRGFFQAAQALALRNGNPPLWRVLAGKERSEASAAALAERIRAELGPAFLVRLD